MIQTDKRGRLILSRLSSQERDAVRAFLGSARRGYQGQYEMCRAYIDAHPGESQQRGMADYLYHAMAAIDHMTSWLAAVDRAAKERREERRQDSGR